MRQATSPEDMKKIVRIYYYEHSNAVSAEWLDENGSSKAVWWNVGQDGDDKLLLGDSTVHVSVLPILATVTGKRFRISESLTRDGVTVWECEDLWKGVQILDTCPAVN